MSNAPLPDPKNDTSWKDWLMQDYSVTQPRWVYLACLGGAVLLLLVALD